MRVRASLLAIGALTALALASCGSAGIPRDAVVAVDGQAITKGTISHWISIAAASNPAGAPKQGSLRDEVLAFLISSEWVLGEAKALGVSVSDKEVEKSFDATKSSQFPKPAEFQKFLSTSHQTVSDLLLRVKTNMLSAKIKQAVYMAKEKGLIAKYYKENISRYSTRERRNLLIIQTNSEAQASKAKQAIQAGSSFGDTASRYSVDPTSRSNGGVLTGVVKGQEEKALDTAIFAAKQGVLTGPIKTSGGYYVFEVQSITPATRQTLKEMEPTIKQAVAETDQDAITNEFAAQFKKKWKAKTSCRTGFVVVDCGDYIAPKVASQG